MLTRMYVSLTRFGTHLQQKIIVTSFTSGNCTLQRNHLLIANTFFLWRIPYIFEVTRIRLNLIGATMLLFEKHAVDKKHAYYRLVLTRLLSYILVWKVTGLCLHFLSMRET